MENKILASWFVSHGYCEYKFYLQYVEKIPIPKTKEMELGTKVHEEKEQKFLEVATPTTWEEFLVSKEYTISKEVMLYTKFENNLLIGQVDEIGVDKNGIYIIEDKPNARPFNSVKNQIYAYCYLFKRNFSEKTAKPIYGILRDRDTNKEVWREPYSLKSESFLIKNINRIKKIVRKEEQPIPTDNPNKCASCIMHKLSLCKYDLTKKSEDLI